MPELQNCPSLGMLSLRAVAPVATTTLCALACTHYTFDGAVTIWTQGMWIITDAQVRQGLAP